VPWSADATASPIVSLALKADIMMLTFSGLKVVVISEAADSSRAVRASGTAGEAVLNFSVFNFFSIAPSLALLVMFLAFMRG